MTEQEKSSAVVDETRESVETTPQPVNTEKKSKNGAALVLSAVAIAIARRQVLGFMAGETASNRANGNQRCAGDATDRLAKGAGEPKSGAGRDYQKQAAQLDDANRQQAALAKQLDEVQQKVATISGSDAKSTAAGAG